MSDNNKKNYGEMSMETRLEINSSKLNLPINELIDRYIRRGIYSDEFYTPPDLSGEELREVLRKDVERDMERRIFRENKFNISLEIGLD